MRENRANHRGRNGPGQGSNTLFVAEMREFASFSPAAQRYIKRSLDIGLARADAFALWARNREESCSIRSQYLHYQVLADIREQLPSPGARGCPEDMLAQLITLGIFDLSQGALDSFSSYRFLYERLLSAAARPWLPSSFCAAAAAPELAPRRRKELLQSISEAAATAPGWSDREPVFLPEWVDKIPLAKAA
ncbi:MAG: hypothetical protein AAFX04_13410 [Pseudomonadota bacterium]